MLIGAQQTTIESAAPDSNTAKLSEVPAAVYKAPRKRLKDGLFQYCGSLVVTIHALIPTWCRLKGAALTPTGAPIQVPHRLVATDP